MLPRQSDRLTLPTAFVNLGGPTLPDAAAAPVVPSVVTDRLTVARGIVGKSGVGSTAAFWTSSVPLPARLSDP
jgi:hypothetical protein